MISPAELQAFIDATYASSGYPPDVQKAILPKIYATTFTAIALAATATNQIQISANGDFFCTTLRYRANLAAAAQTVTSIPVSNARVLITDTGTDEQWSNQAVDINSLCGVAGIGGVDMDLPYPRLIAGRSSVTVQITNFDAVSTPAIDFELIGVLVKIYGRIQPLQQA